MKTPATTSRRLAATSLTVGVGLAAGLVLGGGAAQAARLLTGADVADASLTGRDVRDHTIRAVDLARGTLRAGPRGATGPAGPTGHDGEDGEDGVSALRRLGGDIGAVPATDQWVWAGPPASVSIANGESVVVSAVVPLGTGDRDGARVSTDVCVQGTGATSLANLGGNDYQALTIRPGATGPAAVAAADSLFPGDYRVGACVRTTVALDQNDHVSGWVQVVHATPYS